MYFWMEPFLTASGFTTKQLNERQRAFLASKGFTGSLNKAWFGYLRSIGRTGNLTKMMETIPPVL